MSNIFSRMILITLLSLSAATCVQSADNSMKAKINDFELSKSGEIKWIRFYPVKIGPDRLTVSHSIVLQDKKLSRKIVDLLIFPENPRLPKSLDHAGTKAGCGLQILYDNDNEFYIFALFRQGFKGQAIDYKLSFGPIVESRDDSNLPGNYMLGHGFSSRLYEVLHQGIEYAATKRPIWVPSKW